MYEPFLTKRKNFIFREKDEKDNSALETSSLEGGKAGLLSQNKHTNDNTETMNYIHERNCQITQM